MSTSEMNLRYFKKSLSFLIYIDSDSPEMFEFQKSIVLCGKKSKNVFVRQYFGAHLLYPIPIQC